MTAQTLLVELFVEELPPKALKKLGESFAGTLAASLQAQGLAPADATVTPFASPRRLGVAVSGVLSKAADRAVQQKLMPVAVALTADGQPTPALLKKLAAVGADASVLPQLKRRPTARPRPCSSTAWCPARCCPRACRRPWTRPSPSCPSPRS
jgi:glycyl-tRNA synthetase beta chain